MKSLMKGEMFVDFLKYIGCITFLAASIGTLSVILALPVMFTLFRPIR